MFHEKLDFLMEITDTSNTSLAMAVSLNASHVSRLRLGRRPLPRDPAFLQPMAAYLCRRIVTDQQKHALMSAVGIDLPSDEKERSRLLEEWLADQSDPAWVSDDRDYRLGRLFHSAQGASIEFYYGIEGKRAAVLRFMTAVQNAASASSLLLHSDEEMEWLFGDTEFLERWSALMQDLLEKGNRIIIIHALNRSMEEMLASFKKWLPLYFSGAIDAYYCPKLRDGILQRTLFLSPGIGAILSNSVQSHTEGMLNLYLTDVKAVAALEREYKNHLSLCKKLVHFYTVGSERKFSLALDTFYKEAGPRICVNCGLPLAVLPEDVACHIGTRMGCDEFPAHCARAAARLNKELKGDAVYDMISLPDRDAVLAGKVAVPVYQSPNLPSTFYTPEEYCVHLSAFLKFLSEQPNYHASLPEGELPPLWLNIKEDVGFFVGHTCPHTPVIGISERNLTAAGWAHYRVQQPTVNSEQCIAALHTLLTDLQNDLIDK